MNPKNRCWLVAICLLCSSCSVQKWAVKKAVRALTAEGDNVFTTEDDPQLVAGSLPVLIKAHEALLQKKPNDPRLLLATSKLICMYTYAFVQLPAEQLPDEEADVQEPQLQRAKKLYLRSRNYLFSAMEANHPGFADLITTGKTEPALALTTIRDSSYLYWTGMSWMGAITADKSDMKLLVDMPQAVALLKRVLDLREAYDYGAAHDFFISYYGSLPSSAGGSEAKAREHFAKAIRFSQNRLAGPYLSLATSVCVNKQDSTEFKSLLEQALKIDVDKMPSARLANVIQQQKARWLLAHLDHYFLKEEADTLE